MKGSEKQVAWAEKIRAEAKGNLLWVVSEAEDRLKEGKGDQETVALITKAVEEILSKDSAKWWIENARGLTPLDWKMEVKKAAKRLKRETAEKAPVILEAQAEATIRPEEPVTETVVEILQKENRIEILFDGYREDFRSVMKDLAYRWNGNRYTKSLSFRTEDPGDRVAEVGAHLLSSGFVVRIYDPELREKAAKGEFQPEHRLWVSVFASGSPKGFCISWPHGVDYYPEAKKISGARWDHENKTVVVPMENYAEVRGFAETYGFKLSPGAEALAEAGEQVRRNSLIATPEIPEGPELRLPSDNPPVLEVPEEVGIDESLRDDD